MTSPGLDKIRSRSFFTADHAESVNGKVYANGAFWNRWNSAIYPTVFPPLALVAVLEVPFSQYHQNHTISIGFVDADENALPLRIEGEVRVGADASMDFGESSLVLFTAMVANVPIPKPGSYSFTLAVAGQELDRYQVKALLTGNSPRSFTPGDPPVPSRD